jgi:hypothetical protein
MKDLYDGRHHLSQGVDEEDDHGCYTNDNGNCADGVEQAVAHPGRHGAIAFFLFFLDNNVPKHRQHPKVPVNPDLFVHIYSHSLQYAPILA